MVLNVMKVPAPLAVNEMVGQQPISVGLEYSQSSLFAFEFFDLHSHLIFAKNLFDRRGAFVSGL